MSEVGSGEPHVIRRVAGASAPAVCGAGTKFATMCYIVCMTTKTDTKHGRRRTTSIPVTTMEEIPVLSEKERADLQQSLKDAEARIKAGQGVDYDHKTFKARLVDIYRGSKR
jgi:hypothetical protein